MLSKIKMNFHMMKIKDSEIHSNLRFPIMPRKKQIYSPTV